MAVISSIIYFWLKNQPKGYSLQFSLIGAKTRKYVQAQFDKNWKLGNHFITSFLQNIPQKAILTKLEIQSSFR